jgi:hypothetical protein
MLRQLSRLIRMYTSATSYALGYKTFKHRRINNAFAALQLTTIKSAPDCRCIMIFKLGKCAAALVEKRERENAQLPLKYAVNLRGPVCI